MIKNKKLYQELAEQHRACRLQKLTLKMAVKQMEEMLYFLDSKNLNQNALKKL